MGSERLGEMYDLSCDVTGITGDAVNYTWFGPGITGKEHDHQLLSLSPVTLDTAGHYTCNTTVNSLHLATRHKNVTIASELYRQEWAHVAAILKLVARCWYWILTIEYSNQFLSGHNNIVILREFLYFVSL